MTSLLERELIVVTGKGGTGKTTVACALGLLAARRGLRTIVVEVGDQHHIADLFAAQDPRTDDRNLNDRDPDYRDPDHRDPDHHDPERHDHGHHAPDHPDHHDRLKGARHDHHAETVALQENLWSTSINPDRAMIEWLQTLTGRISARLLASSSTFHYFAAAAPGAKELVSMIEVRALCEGPPRRGRAHGKTPNDGRPYDLVILDAPATGHALAMLRSPQTFAAIVRAGPLADQAQAVRELLADPHRCGYVAVAQGSEMAVAETLELEQGLRRHLDRDLDAIVVNGIVPRRFTREELAQISQLDGDAANPRMREGEGVAHSRPTEEAGQAGRATEAQIVRSAARTARAVHERARTQQSQITRLRRKRFSEGLPPSVVTVPFSFTRELDLAAIRQIAAQLARKL